MMQEDSNGETFEIIDRKTEGLSITDKTESLSSMSSVASLLPSPSVSLSSVPGGNLLSNVAPPTALPTFITQTTPSPYSTLSPSPVISAPSPLPDNLPQILNPSSSGVMSTQPTNEPFCSTQFSAAIPPNKGILHGPPNQSNILQQTNDTVGIFSWVKGALSNNTLLQKVAEKAKSSVDSMITTLDPQMREYIYSGGDIEVVVASLQEHEISPIREAFQSVFGKATISGISSSASDSQSNQLIGYSVGVKAAENKIQMILKDLKLSNKPPVVAIENFLVDIDDQWYEVAAVCLEDPTLNIKLQTFSQFTPIPNSIITVVKGDSSMTLNSLMANNLNVHQSDWHSAFTGVSKREILLVAAKVIAGLYKNKLIQKA